MWLGRLYRGITGERLVLCVAITLVVYLVIGPLGMLLYSSFRTVGPHEPGPFTIANYIEVYLSGETYELLLNTSLFAFVSVSIGIAIGISFAWLVERTNTPLRNVAFTLIPLTMATPSMLYAIAWVLLLSPKVGLVNIALMNLFGLENPPINPYGILGMGFVEGLRLASGIFLMTVGVFRGMDPSLEEAAFTSGANIFQTMHRITFRLMVPGILAAAIYSLTTAFDTFEIPAVMGMRQGTYVFATKIYEASHSMPRNYGMVSTLGVILLFFGCLWVYLYGLVTRRTETFATITGKGYRSRVIDLGRWKYVGTALFALHFSIVIVAPMSIVLWASFQPYYEMPSQEALSRVSLDNYRAMLTFPWLSVALKNTVIMALIAPTLAVLICSVVSWIVIRTKIRGRRILDMLSFLPHVIPGIVMGLAFMWLYLRIDFIPIYGTLWIMILAFATAHMAYGTRTLNAAMIQLHKELEEASQISGASWMTTFSRITIPLLIPSIVSVWVWSAIHTIRSTSIPVMLYSSKSRVLSVFIWDLWGSGHVGYTSAVGVMLLIILAMMLFMGRVVATRRSRQS